VRDNVQVPEVQDQLSGYQEHGWRPPPAVADGDIPGSMQEGSQLASYCFAGTGWTECDSDMFCCARSSYWAARIAWQRWPAKRDRCSQVLSTSILRRAA
jgi:hypothetical protein